MIPVCASSMFFHEYPLDEIFDAVEEAGLDGIEFWMETPHFWLQGLPAGDLEAALRSHPGIVSLQIHAPVLDLNPCSINPDVAEASCRWAVAAVELAERVGAPVVTVHPGKRTARRPPMADDYRRFNRYLSVLRDAVAGGRVMVAMENVEPRVNAMIATPEEARTLLDREGWLSFTLDISHAMNHSREFLIRFIETCGDRLVNVHVSRAEEGVMHLPLEGDPVVGSVLGDIAAGGYRGPLTLEIEDQNLVHDLTLEEKIQLLAGEADFLRRCTG
ncbi:MAG: sugar phosphate isomerase/epimerase [Methanomicrobiales archaeon]|nr:sugar phosphate isomerase/epimerase [Methanomicrobiales archaeon]